MKQYKEAEIARAVEEIKAELARRAVLERDACLAFWRELAIADQRKEVDDGQTPTFPPRKGRAFSGEQA